MVNFEAARALCEMKNVTATQLIKPISGKPFLNRLMINQFLRSISLADLLDHTETCP